MGSTPKRWELNLSSVSFSLIGPLPPHYFLLLTRDNTNLDQREGIRKAQIFQLPEDPNVLQIYLFTENGGVIPVRHVCGLGVKEEIGTVARGTDMN